jgi:hypothetical protein
MEEDNSDGLMANFIQVNGKEGKDMELAYGAHRKETVIWENGSKGSSRAKVFIKLVLVLNELFRSKI